MGRELRMVPPNWQHPKYTDDDGEMTNSTDLFGL